MLNKATLGEYFTGLVILSKAIPESLTDANGDPVRAGIWQQLHDAADELELGAEVEWDAQGEPADVVEVPRTLLRQVHEAGDELSLVLADLPLWGGGERHG
ncbi:hypothetical protein [Lacticaseibacillus jixiensis]|uniref:hypothetical protein n=1 Tax=Lacticaseibacillus jixiensis TaxID=3231926 RepID=UPI0036F2B6F9